MSSKTVKKAPKSSLEPESIRRCVDVLRHTAADSESSQAYREHLYAVRG